MALVIEDGSGIPDANSWVTVSEAKAYATARGLSLASADNVIEQHLIKGADYLNGLGHRYKGRKVYPLNLMQWPRYGVSLDGFVLDQDAIPEILKRAQIELAVAANEGIDFAGNSANNKLPVIRRKVDVIETEFAAPGSVSGYGKPIMSRVTTLLAPLFSSFTLTSERV